MRVRIRSLVLFIVLSSSSADVEVKETLTGGEGGNIPLPAPVGEFGLLSHDFTTLAVVQNWELDIWQEHYRDRILWNRTTGLFTITGLQSNDSGIYTVESKEGAVFESYKLTVYAPVAGPAVGPVNVTPDSCSLLCSVDGAAEITLRWYRDQEVVNQISHAGSLLLTVTWQNLGSSYRCEAGNPAENKMLQVDVETLCSGLKPTGCSELWWFLVALLGFKAAVVVVLVFLQKGVCGQNRH